jgi:tetratricopeptide (TPR) repeat protein
MYLLGMNLSSSQDPPQPEEVYISKSKSNLSIKIKISIVLFFFYKRKSDPEPEQQAHDIPDLEQTEKSEEQLKKEEAIKEKDLGNAAYKKREFEKALEHYDKAWELDPTNALILINKAGEYSNHGSYRKAFYVNHYC